MLNPNKSQREIVLIVEWNRFLIGIRANQESHKVLEIYIANLQENCGKPTDIWQARVLQNPKSLEGFFVEYQSGKKAFVKENDPSLNPGDQVCVQLLHGSRDDKPPSFSKALQYPSLFSVWKPGQKTHRVSQSIPSDAQDAWKKQLKRATLPNELLIRTFAGICTPSKLERLAAESAAAQAFTEKAANLPLFEKLEIVTAFEHVALKLLTKNTAAIHAAEKRREEASSLLSACTGPAAEKYKDIGNVAACESIQDFPEAIKKELRSCLGSFVGLVGGGSVYFEQTKAMHTVDVNSAGYSSKVPYANAVKNINQEAAECIARQICLRNLSGLIAIDFISSNEKEALQALADRIAPELERGKQKFELSNVDVFGVCMASRRRNGLTLSEALAGRHTELHKEL